MTLMRVRREAQLSLPVDVQRALNVQEGDFLNAEILAEGVLLRPAGVVKRQRALERIAAATATVIDQEPDSEENVRAAEEAIAETIREFRRANA